MTPSGNSYYSARRPYICLSEPREYNFIHRMRLRGRLTERPLWMINVVERRSARHPDRGARR